MYKEISTRQLEIIEAAGKILTNSGVSGLTIKNLAKEMQFTEAALYRHFESKEEIIVALLNYLAKNMDERYSDLKDAESAPDQQLLALFQNQLNFFKQNPHFVVVVFSEGLMEESQRINQAIRQVMQVTIKHLTPIIAEGQQTGIFTNSIQSEDLVHIAMGSFRLQMFKWRMANFEFDILQKGKEMIQSILIVIQEKK